MSGKAQAKSKSSIPIPRPESPPVAVLDPRASVIDEYGELDRQVQAFAPIKARHDKLREQILSWYPDLAANASVYALGDAYSVRIGERGDQRAVTDMGAVCKAFGGWKEFLKSVSITIKAMEEKLGKEAAAKYLRWCPIGPRKLTVVLRAPVSAAKAA